MVYDILCAVLEYYSIELFANRGLVNTIERPRVPSAKLPHSDTAVVDDASRFGRCARRPPTMPVCQITCPRRALERISDRKKRRLAVDDSDYSSPLDSVVEIVEDSQTSLKEHRDLFGELIPDDGWKICSPSSVNRSTKSRTSSSKTKKSPYPSELFADSPSVTRPTRVFIPTPRIMRIMKDAQTELYSLMGLNKSSSDVSSTSNDNINVSGVQSLPNVSASDECSDGPNSSLFSGVVAFVDYKFEDDRSGAGVTRLLHQMGAQVEKTFNRKVTHVVFRDGYRKTYDQAIERKIPLVAARWIENSKLANKILDPDDYPPIGLEKYTIPRVLNYNLPKSLKKYEKFLRQSDIDRDNLIMQKCDNLMKEVASLDRNCRYRKIVEECETPENATETPKTPKPVKEPDETKKIKDIIDLLSDQLCKVLNTDSPVPDEQTSELYFPVSIRLLRKYLTPRGNENKSSSELDSDLNKIENRLNLNVHARQRLRKLLFPCDKELQNMSTTSDFPSPSPIKIKISAPGRLISTKKKKKEDKKLFEEQQSQNKNVNSKEKTPQKKLDMNNILQWRIPTDLRPIQIKKKYQLKKNNVDSKTLTQKTIPNMFSRNSSMIFQTPNNSVESPGVVQSISCTGMSKREVDTIKQYMQNLGIFTYHTNVELSTTYLVTKNQPKRTLNMVYAMAFGCFIVSEDWIHQSYKRGSWQCHEKYLISDLSNPVKEFQNRRHTFGSLLTFHIFDDAGKIYVSDSCQPQARHLKRLVRACGGKCTSTESLANVVVGYTPRMNTSISEKWILDCITEGSLLNISQYTMTNSSLTI